MKSYIFIALFALLFVACDKEKETSEKSLRPVKYQKIALSTGSEEHTFSGVAKADNEVNLSFKVGGSLSAVYVKLGDKVRKGQLIATIDPKDYAIQIDQASAQKKGAEANAKSSQANVKSTEASLKNAEGQLLNAKSTYQRIEKLYENNSVALSEYEQAKAGLAAAEAQYDATKSQYAAAKSQAAAAATQITASAKQVEAASNQANYTKLFAPINGIITQLDAETNEIVGSGRAIAVISSDRDMKVEVGVPEVMVNKVEKGQSVHVVFSSDIEQEFTGKVEQIAFSAGSSPTYPVIIGINESTDRIRPGMAATVRFSFHDKDENIPSKMLVPIAAVGEDTEGNFVFVLIKNTNDTYHAEKRKVKIGQLFSEGFAIINGLEINDLVAVAGLKTLMNGMEVKLLK